MKYKLLLFDADETLFDFKKTEAEALKKLFSSMNTDLELDVLLDTYKDINKNIWKEFEDGKISLASLKIERFERLCQSLNLSTNATQMGLDFEDYLGEGSYLYDETEDLLAYLSQNYKIGIVTNGLAKVQNKRIRNSKVSSYFEHVIISGEINLAKPDRKIFDYTLDLFNHTDRSSVLMIGDKLSSDILGGLNSKIDTCWFNSDKSINNLDINPTFEINNLSELKNIL